MTDGMSTDGGDRAADERRATRAAGPMEGTSPSADLELELEPIAGEVPDTGRDDWRHVLRGILTNPSSLLGVVLIVGFALVALAAPVLAPCPVEQAPRQQAYCGRNAYKVPKFGHSTTPLPPGSEVADGVIAHFGTTVDQYDIYYGVVWGARTAFKVGIIVVGAALLIGLAVGSVSAFYGGWIDEILMRVVEVFQAFPFLLAAITLASVLGANPRFGQGIVPAMLALITFGWTGYARLIRSDILSVKQREYVLAARGLGANDVRLIVKHVLPNSIYPVLVLASLNIGTIVLTFAALSFFGLGVPDGYADWGQMISSARNRIPSLDQDWYIVLFPGLSIVLFSLAWNLIGDTFRDILDPRLAGTSHNA